MSKRTYAPAGKAPQPRSVRDDGLPSDMEPSNQDIPIDDPGDAQRSSKTEPDGDGEEEY